jgi:hypothetical protein
MKEGLAALTKFVKVVMAYRPDRQNPAKLIKKQRTITTRKRDTKTPSRDQP